MASNHPTIKIAEPETPIHPVRSEAAGHGRVGRHEASFAGGIYNTRNISRVSVDRRSVSRFSVDRRTIFSGFDPEEGDDWRGDDHRHQQVFTGTTLLWLAYQSVGVIYGDIGTSPLYVFSSTFSSGPPSTDDVLQVLSIIIWSLLIVVTLKYVIIILNADNEGEGGTFSCYSLLTRYANLTERDPREQATLKMQRHLSEDLRPTTLSLREKFENSKFLRGLLKVIGVLAVAMVMSDGVLTPAQSVLGAVQGLDVVSPNISNGTVVGVSCAILVILFVIQPFGLTKLGSAFAPILGLWLAFNGAFGIYNLVKNDYTVLKAFNPYYIFEFFIQKKTEGWKLLGGILLAFTGVEALFADLGAFSKRAIQLSWLCYTLPCLLLSYSGQAAYLAAHPEGYANPFFNSVPPGMLYPTLVVAILAAIIASQAIITATFQLINQIMKLSYCPQVKVVHTSKTFHGQLYVPFLNWLLLIGTILVTAIYNNTTSLGNAYGVCVMFVTFFDTCMVTLVAILVWKLPAWLVILPWLFFSTIDGLFLTSALNKVPDGAWFTITLSAILAALFLLWRYGKESQWKAEAEDRIKTNLVLHPDASGEKLQLTSRFGGDILSQIRGFGVFFDKTGVLTPAVFTHFVTKFSAVPDIMVFFHLHPVETPSVPDEERYAVTRFTSIPGCYRLVIKHGFMDEVMSPDLAALIYEKVRNFVVRQAQEKYEAEQKIMDDSVTERDGPASSSAVNLQRIQSEDESKEGDEKGESATEQKTLAENGNETADAETVAAATETDADNGTATVASSETATAPQSPEIPTPARTDKKKLTVAIKEPPTPAATAAASSTAFAHTPKTPKTPAFRFFHARSRSQAQTPMTGVFPPMTPGFPPMTPMTSTPIELRDEKVAAELARLDRAYAAKILYIVGKEQMRVRKAGNGVAGLKGLRQNVAGLPRRVMLGAFLWIRDNTRAKIANLRLAMDRVVEVGFVRDI